MQPHLPRHDSNVDLLDQSQGCYRCTTGQTRTAGAHRARGDQGIEPKLPGHDSNVDFLIQSQACYQLHHQAFSFRAQTKKPRSRWASGFGIPWESIDLVTRRAASPAVAGLAAAGMRGSSSLLLFLSANGAKSQLNRLAFGG
jgi:hypothetical protein